MVVLAAEGKMCAVRDRLLSNMCGIGWAPKLYSRTRIFHKYHRCEFAYYGILTQGAGGIGMGCTCGLADACFELP